MSRLKELETISKMEVDRHLKIDPVLWRRVKIEAVQSDLTISELFTSDERWPQTRKCMYKVTPWYHIFSLREPYGE